MELNKGDRVIIYPDELKGVHFGTVIRSNKRSGYIALDNSLWKNDHMWVLKDNIEPIT